MGATLTKDSTGGKNYSGGASVSVNLIDKDVHANMDGVDLTGVIETENDTQKKVTNIDVAAYESDVQVTGGVRADIATGGGSLVGGSVTVADINNDINAGISGGTYTDVNNVNVKGLLATTQVTAAVSAGVAAGGNGNNAFSGAAVYNGLSNTIESAIDGATITAGGNVSATAKDTKASSEEAKPYQDLLGSYANHNQFAADRGIDTSGTSFYIGTDQSNDGLDTAGVSVVTTKMEAQLSAQQLSLLAAKTMLPGQLLISPILITHLRLLLVTLPSRPAPSRLRLMRTLFSSVSLLAWLLVRKTLAAWEA